MVYLAQSSRLGYCVVKALRDERMQDDRVVDLLHKEARIWTGIDGHPYIVRAFHVEKASGHFYITMEYVPPNDRGVNDLEGYLRRRIATLGQSLGWAVEFCYGMEYAYSKGIRCHGDIKPTNILIGPDSRVRVTDFGIGQAAMTEGTTEGPDVESGTRAVTVYATPFHMPPEQFVDAASCDARSDIYSFGTVLFQIASGRLPFYPPPIPPGPDRNLKIWAALAKLHREEPVSKLDSALNPIIAKCMEKDPVNRYTSFPQLRTDLEALLKEQTGKVVAVPPHQFFEAVHLSNKGMSFASLEQYQDALACYDQALGIDPDSAPILNNKGNALNRMGRCRGAVTFFDQAIALDPKYAAPHLNKGISFFHLDRYQEALECFDEALALEPCLADGWVRKGVVLGRLSRADEAAACYDRALSIDPGNPVAWFNKAEGFHRWGQMKDALECIERALHSDPRYGVAWVKKGVVLAALDRHEEALQALERALMLDSGSGKAWYEKGNVLRNLENHGEALQCFERAAELEPKLPSIWYNKALAETKLARNAEAQSSLRQFLAVAPADHEHRAVVSSLLERLDKGERVGLGSLNMGDNIRRKDGESQGEVEVPEHTATVRRQTGHADDELPAAECLERASMTYNRGEFKEAIAWYDRALAADPENAVALAGKGESLKRLGRFGDAVIAFDRALARNPRDSKAWVGLGLCLDSLKRHKEAASTFEKALQIDPGNADTWNRRGASLFSAGEIEQAHWCFDRALVEDPSFAVARFNKATAEETLGRRLEAAHSFQQFLDVASPDLASQIERARARLAELRSS